jgi:hypothetical protein
MTIHEQAVLLVEDNDNRADLKVTAFDRAKLAI